MYPSTILIYLYKLFQNTEKHLEKWVHPQLPFTCSKRTIKGYFTPFPSVSIADFKHVKVSWVGARCVHLKDN